MIHTGAFFNDGELNQARGATRRAQKVDGGHSAMGAAGAVKRNQQYQLGPSDTAELSALVVNALRRNMDVFRMALPAEISTPMINFYDKGMTYGAHYDAPLFSAPGGNRMRADLSATVFLTNPADYTGGELVMLNDGQERAIKLAAGHIVVYPAALLHEVRPVLSGSRHAVVFWIQSMIQDQERRELFYRLDRAIEQVARKLPDSDEVRDLSGVFSGLGRVWLEP